MKRDAHRDGAGGSTPLQGSLATVSLSGLLQLLAGERRTGRVDVRSSARSGSLWLHEGGAVHARYEHAPGASGVSGEEAFYQLASLEDGEFRFEPGAEPTETTLSGSTERLLMEAAVRQDHATRRATTVPSSSAVPAFAPVPEGRTTPRFTTLQWRVLACIDGRKDLARLSLEIGLSQQALSAMIQELVGAGVLKLA